MAKVTEQSSKRLLEQPAKTVAILGHRLSAAGNVNVFFGEVEAAPSNDGGAFNVFYGSSELKRIKYAWQVMKPEIAEQLYGIKDSSESTTEMYLENPQAADKYVKVMQTESVKDSAGDPITNPETGEIVLDDKGRVIYRNSKVILAEKDYQHTTQKLPRFDGASASEVTSAAPFDVANL